MTRRKLGKLPARPGAVRMRLRDYFDPGRFPAVPAVFGHETDVADWGMLANDRVGCCTISGAAHEDLLWSTEGGAPAVFTDDTVLSDYSAITGYDPSQTQADGSNPTDSGADIATVAAYRRTTGILDAAGNRHKLGAYVALTPGDPDELAAAAYVFSACGIGLRFPDFAEAQFDAGQPWDNRGHYDATIDGGHYVPVIGRLTNGNFLVVTWGAVQEATEGFLRQYIDEGLAYLSTEFLTAGVSPEHFDLAQLQTDFASFTRAGFAKP